LKNFLKEENTGMQSQNENLGRVRNSAVASQPCPSCHTTADKELCYASPKLPSPTSFIRRTLSEIALRYLFR